MNQLEIEIEVVGESDGGETGDAPARPTNVEVITH
jgi:hypothetical protein